VTNLTISASDEILRRVRVEAATRGLSVSRFVGEVLKERFQDEDTYELAMAGFFFRVPYLDPAERADGRTWPTRSELHQRQAD
jgi:hypothetical protein